MLASAVISATTPTPALAASLLHAGSKPSTQATPNSVICDTYGDYFNTSHAGNDQFYGVSSVFHNYNGTGQYEDMTFTSTATGTVGVDLSVSATIDANAIVAGAQVTTSATLHTSLSITQSNSVTVKSVPPGTNVYAQYGVWRNVSKGHYVYYYSNCTTHDYGYVYAYVPDGIGWNTWN